MTKKRRVSFCPHCGNTAPQRLAYEQVCATQEYYNTGDRAFSLEAVYFVAVCETCNEVLVYLSKVVEHAEEYGDFETADLVWPDSGELHNSVPESIRECYREAIRIRSLAPNAFAVQVRRTLEATCDNRGAKPGTLQQRLEDLVAKGQIPPVLAEMTHALRILGNAGAHSTSQSVKPGHVQAIDEFLRAVVEYTYVAPYKIKVFQETLSKFRRKGDA